MEQRKPLSPFFACWIRKGFCANSTHFRALFCVALNGHETVIVVMITKNATLLTPFLSSSKRTTQSLGAQRRHQQPTKGTNDAIVSFVSLKRRSVTVKAPNVMRRPKAVLSSVSSKRTTQSGARRHQQPTKGNNDAIVSFVSSPRRSVTVAPNVMRRPKAGVLSENDDVENHHHPDEEDDDDDANTTKRTPEEGTTTPTRRRATGAFAALATSTLLQSRLRFDRSTNNTIVAEAMPAFQFEEDGLKTASSGLRYADVVVGTGASPTKGQTIQAHYTGRLTNGRVFDSSYDRGSPLKFKVGVRQVIQGWDDGILGAEGIEGMKVGGKRVLIIPPELGYGARGAGGVIPGNATLQFDVELVAVL